MKRLPQTPEQRRTQGRRHRKAVARAHLAEWNPKLRKRDLLAVLDEAMRGRIPTLLALKNERMACTPFTFFRGAVPIMAYDLSISPHTTIVNQICGDAHVQNFGAYSGDDGLLTFDINDFDETTRAPFEWDIKRMATSILLAGEQAGIRRADRIAATRTFLRAYTRLMATMTTLTVLDVARYKVHGIDSAQPISALLRKAERATPQHSLDSLTVQSSKSATHRIFASRPPVLRRVQGEERRAVLASIDDYRETLAPERQHFLDQLRPVDVAFKVVGTGSVGMRDYCIYFEGNGAADPLFLQIKQETASAYARYLPRSTHPPHAGMHQGQRVVNGQRAMQFQSDPMLGWTSIAGEEYLVRQLNDHKAALDVTTLNAAGLSQYAEVCGKILAHGHARSGDCHLIAGYIGKGRTFAEAIVTFARAYARQTNEDWKLFVAATGKK